MTYKNPKERNLMQTVWEKENNLVTSIFSYSNNVSFPINIEIVVCKCFQFRES